jgi:hypothetical protein
VSYQNAGGGLSSFLTMRTVRYGLRASSWRVCLGFGMSGAEIISRVSSAPMIAHQCVGYRSAYSRRVHILHY